MGSASGHGNRSWRETAWAGPWASDPGRVERTLAPGGLCWGVLAPPLMGRVGCAAGLQEGLGGAESCLALGPCPQPSARHPARCSDLSEALGARAWCPGLQAAVSDTT